MISCFCCKVDEIFALLGYYTVYSGNSIPVGCPKTLVRNYYYTLRNTPDERRSHNVRLYLMCG